MLHPAGRTELVWRLKFTVWIHVWCVLLLLLLLFCCCVTVSFPRLCQVMRLYVGSCWSVLHCPSVCLFCFLHYFLLSVFVSCVCSSVALRVCLYFVCSCPPHLLLLLFLLLLLLSPGLLSLWYLQIGVWGVRARTWGGGGGGGGLPNSHCHVYLFESSFGPNGPARANSHLLSTRWCWFLVCRCKV